MVSLCKTLPIYRMLLMDHMISLHKTDNHNVINSNIFACPALYEIDQHEQRLLNLLLMHWMHLMCYRLVHETQFQPEKQLHITEKHKPTITIYLTTAHTQLIPFQHRPSDTNTWIWIHYFNSSYCWTQISWTLGVRSWAHQLN